MPRTSRCSNCKENQKLPGLISTLSHFHSQQPRYHRTCNFRSRHKCITRCGGSDRRSKTWIQKEAVGTHLIRSGAAMAMYLGECPVFMIMLIGRWTSDAFLRHIHKQVMEFSQNVAKKMLSCQNFWHIPDVNERIPSDDPHIRNHPNNAKTRKNVGGDSYRRVRLPPFALYN